MKRLAFVILLFIHFASNGQAPHFFSVELLRKKEPVQVNVIFPDRVGYLWIGTNKGLFRFDGHQSIQFKKSDGLPDENVTAIAQDSVGRIWCGHKSGELSILEHNKIIKFEPNEGSAVGLVSDILFDRSGTMWFSTNNDGLYYYLNQRLYRLDEAEGLRDLFLYDLEQDHEGNIWAGSDGGIAICTLVGNKATIKTISQQDGLPDNIIHKIREDKDSTFWLGTEDSGIIHYLPATKKFETQTNLTLKPINDLVVEGNNIWLATKDQGVVLYDKVQKSVALFKDDLPSIETLAKDAEGNIWYGSKTGLLRSYGNHISFLGLENELNDQNVFALASDEDGKLWFSTQQGLYVRYKDKSGNYKIDLPLKGTSFERQFIISLYADANGFVWAGSYGQGALRINTKSYTTTSFYKELRNGNVLGITGKDDVVWLATLGGVTQITAGPRLEFKNIGSAEGLATDYIYQVFIDSKERIWLATDGKGADMIDKAGIHHYTKGLDSKVVYGFAEDVNHTIWANVQNDGLYSLEGDIFKLQSDSILSASRNSEISCLTSTRPGNLIMANDFGLEVFALQRKQRYYLGTEQDFQDRHPNLNATTKDARGNIYFGTEKGIVVYNGGLANLLTNPVPHIESLKVANQKIETDGGLVFGYEENNITVNYVGFWFQNPEAVSYKYQLENYDRDWISSGDRTATYSSLPPGDYTFRLKVSNDDSFQSTQEASVHFVIKPPFWRTYWFYALMAVVIVASAYGLINYRERRLLADKHELEEKVKERTSEILKMNSEIKQQAEEIKAINDNLEKLVLERTKELDRKNKALQEAAFINAHNLRSPVASILGLIHLIKKLNWTPQDKEYIDHLDQSANRLDEVVNTISEAIDKGDDLHFPERMDDE